MPLCRRIHGMHRLLLNIGKKRHGVQHQQQQLPTRWIATTCTTLQTTRSCAVTLGTGNGSWIQMLKASNEKNSIASSQLQAATAFFFSSSTGTHDDFAPKRKVVVDDVDDAVHLIEEHVKNNRIMLYMKGNPSMPMCGFSARVVQILQKESVDFSSVNVLDYPAIREGVKKYSQWPTIPQLYIDGEFVGGCDIVISMHESGELSELLKADTVKSKDS